MHRYLRAFMVLTVTVATWLSGEGGNAAGVAVESLDKCDVKVQKAPRDPLSYYCYYQAFRGGASGDEAVRRLEAILSFDPERHRVRMTLGMIEKLRESPRAETLLRDAVDGMERQEDHHGVVYAGLDLSAILTLQGRMGDADLVLARVARAAEATGDRALLASVQANQAMRAVQRSDYGRALHLFRRAEAVVFPEGPTWLQRNVAGGLGTTYWHLGQYRKAMAAYERQADLSGLSGDLFDEASARYGIASSAWELEARGRFDREICKALTQSALEAAIRGQNRTTEARTRIMLADWLGAVAAIPEYKRAGELGGAVERWTAMRRVAGERAEMGSEHGDEAFRLVDTAIAESRAAGDRFETVRGIMGRAYITTLLRSREDAVAAWSKCLDEIEAVRASQPEETSRARALSSWSSAYYRFSGYLLGSLDHSPAPAENLDLAFQAMERFRARVLLDVLDVGASTASGSAGDLKETRAGVLSQIASVQKRLMDPALGDGERTENLGRLERLENREAGLRDRITREDPAFAAIHAPSIPTLDELRGLLDDDEALLAFQIYEEQNVHFKFDVSWLLVATRDGVHAERMPVRRTLEDQLAIFEGLIENRDGSERSAAADLYDMLLGNALARLRSPVRKLVIVPDAALHRLPFAALREDPLAEPLGARYKIAIAPSATIWMRWRRSETLEGPSAVLALADPEISPGAEDEAFRSSGPWIEGLRLGALPYARQEARALVRAVGGSSRVLGGSEASERNLKATDLEDYGILHFATHAVVDPVRPERSAIFLASGDPDEDGLLQPREIADLRLDDKVVILTACRGASGTLVEGEGVMGLARAFLHAGARAVVAGLWSLQDEETAALMDGFSQRLAKGSSVASALTAARRSRIDAGAPTAAWAGLILIGDGDFVPVPGGQSAARWIPWLLGTALPLVLVALWYWSFARRRRSLT